MISATARSSDVDIRALTDAWREDVRQTLHEVLGDVRRVAFLDCPDYGNVGDSLIGLGQFAVFDHAAPSAAAAGRNPRWHVAHASSLREYDPHRLRSQIGPDGALLIQGGGNFGDLWPHHQRFREQLVQSFPDMPIVQLSQSIFFEDEAQARASAEILRGHPRFLVLCRDDESLERARVLGLQARLCPDMALVLPPFGSDVAPSSDVVVVRRQDKESRDTARRAMPSRWHVEDWTADVPRAVRARRIATSARRFVPTGVDARLGVWSFRRAFEARVDSGLALVRRGRVVITDRLHVHVLCCLAGRPHAFVDNSYGKVSALWRAWTHRLPFAQPCSTWDDAIDWAVHATGGGR